MSYDTGNPKDYYFAIDIDSFKTTGFLKQGIQSLSDDDLLEFLLDEYKKFKSSI